MKKPLLPKLYAVVRDGALFLAAFESASVATAVADALDAELDAFGMHQVFVYESPRKKRRRR